MNGPDAMHDEMPGFFPGRPDGEHDEPLLDMLLERRPITPGTPPELHDLARVLAAAASPGEPGALAGEDAARAAFRRLPSPAGTAHPAPTPARHPGPLGPSPGSASRGTGQHAGRPLAAREPESPRPSAASLAPSPSGTACPSLPG